MTTPIFFNLCVMFLFLADEPAEESASARRRRERGWPVLIIALFY